MVGESHQLSHRNLSACPLYHHPLQSMTQYYQLKKKKSQTQTLFTLREQLLVHLPGAVCNSNKASNSADFKVWLTEANSQSIPLRLPRFQPQLEPRGHASIRPCPAGSCPAGTGMGSRRCLIRPLLGSLPGRFMAS